MVFFCFFFTIRVFALIIINTLSVRSPNHLARMRYKRHVACTKTSSIAYWLCAEVRELALNKMLGNQIGQGNFVLDSRWQSLIQLLLHTSVVVKPPNINATSTLFTSESCYAIDNMLRQFFSMSIPFASLPIKILRIITESFFDTKSNNFIR
jgi:hypothetical protein